MTAGESLFLLLLASLPIMRPTIFEIGPYSIPPTDVIFVVAAAATAVDLIARRKPLPTSGFLVRIAMYGAALACATIFSADRSRSAVKLAGNGYLMGLAALGLVHVRSLDGLRRALLAWTVGLAVTIVAAFAGLVLFVVGVRDPHRNLFLSIHGSLPDGGYPRVQALFLNPNMYCAYLAATLALVVTVARLRWIDMRSAVVLAAATVFAAVWSLSPGLGGLFLIGAYAAWTFLRSRRPGLARTMIAIAAVGAAAFFAAATVAPEPGAPLSLAHLRASSRLLTWSGALASVPRHPWFGRGLGLEVVEIGYVNPSGIYELLTDAHNTWLSILAQCGVAGLAAFCALVAALVRGARGTFESTRRVDVAVGGLEIAFAAGFLYQTLTGSFENTRYVWALIGLLAATIDLRASIAPVTQGPTAPT